MLPRAAGTHQCHAYLVRVTLPPCRTIRLVIVVAAFFNAPLVTHRLVVVVVLETPSAEKGEKHPRARAVIDGVKGCQDVALNYMKVARNHNRKQGPPV